MSELEKRLNALYLVVEASVADDINNHVMEVVKERDALRLQTEADSWHLSEASKVIDALRAALDEIKKEINAHVAAHPGDGMPNKAIGRVLKLLK